MTQGGRALHREAQRRLEDELRLIDELGLAGFFLLHREVLELAREIALEVRGPDSPRRFLPPGRGRGSSVGSIVCYLTGLSHVDPVENDLSLGRFLNRELASVPDIDLDFPRDIREKLIVAVTERYGREHAALVASFATYRSRGAIRDVGKALGLPYAELERLARLTDGWNATRVREELERLPDGERKLESRRWRAFAWLAGEIAGLPRHVSQHPGGMIVSTRPLVELVPVQPAAMAGRQLCQWDKDSCSDAGFLKIDLLGLGMLSAVEDCVEQIARTRGEVIDLSRIPLDDPDVFTEIQRADTVGTFQIESRAQMQSLLRTKPANLDDLTVQVALVRPGPIQGKAVHPYIDARERLREDPSYVWPVDHELLREPLRGTFGVVVFQDQVLEVAMTLAGFTVGEAEGLRRAMSRKRSHDALEAYRGRFVEGAAGNDVDAETANLVFDKLVGFSGFGFPKSHAAAFGLLAYQSQWLRRNHPAEFLCALLNEQPMGFYPPATLVRDAQRRGVEVLPPDVNLSRATCRLEGESVRIGLSYIASVGKDDAEALVAERDANGPFRDVARPRPPQRLSREELEALVKGGACDAFGKRRDLLWELGLAYRPQSVPGTSGEAKQLPLTLDPTTATPELRDLTRWERMLADYRHTGLSVGTHPLALLRAHLPEGTLSSAELVDHPHGRQVSVAGMTVARQRPSTAKGIVFMLLEDEHGQMNLIVPSQVYERHRATVRAEPLVLARGRFERIGENRNVLVSAARVARPARSPGRRERHRLVVAPAAALLRPPVRSVPAAGKLGEAGAAASSACRSFRESVNAVSTSVRWVNACGKLPTSRPRSGSYSSESRPEVVPEREQPLEELDRVVERGPAERAPRRARTSTAGTRPRPAGDRRRPRSPRPRDTARRGRPASGRARWRRRCRHARVVRRKEADERDEEQARVEPVRAEVLDEGAELRR